MADGEYLVYHLERESKAKLSGYDSAPIAVNSFGSFHLSKDKREEVAGTEKFHRLERLKKVGKKGWWRASLRTEREKRAQRSNGVSVMPAMPKAKYEAACVHVIAWHYPAS